MNMEVFTPSRVIVNIQKWTSCKPGVKNRLRDTVRRRTIITARRPFTINFKGTLDNLMRHTLFGVELNLGSAIFARVGYSYRQAMETVGADVLNMSGFSFGLGIRGKRWEFSYARSNYHLGQAPNYFTLSYCF